jgi:hypothetical protein
MKVLDIEKEALYNTNWCHSRVNHQQLSSKYSHSKNANVLGQKRNGFRKNNKSKNSYELFDKKELYEKEQIKCLLYYLIKVKNIQQVETLVLKSNYVTKSNCLDKFSGKFWTFIRHVKVGKCQLLCQKNWHFFFSQCTSGLLSIELEIKDMKYYRLSVADLKEIILLHKDTLQRLKLKYMLIDMKSIIDIHFFEICIIRCVHLTHLEIYDAEYCGSRALAVLSEHCKQLKKLCLSGFDGSLIPLRSLELLHTLKLNNSHVSGIFVLKQLKSISLVSCYLHLDRTGGNICMDNDDDDDMMIIDFEIVSGTSFNIGLLTELENLEISNTKNCNFEYFLMSNAQEFNIQMQTLIYLKSLTLGNINKKSIIRELRIITGLTYLKLIDCQFIVHTEYFKQAFESLSNSLQHLALENCGRTAIDLLPLIFSSLKNLKTLDIIGSPITHNHIRNSFADEPSKELRKIMLLGSSVTIGFLCQIRDSFLPKLTTVKLDTHKNGKHLPMDDNSRFECVKRGKKCITFCIS